MSTARLHPPPHPHPCLPSPWADTAAPSTAWTQDPTPPIIWSVAGTDSGGGAGLSADNRAASAMGVHLCAVVAAVTAQHSTGVEAVFALPGPQVQAQLQALAADMPPRAIKTGLLASVQAVQALVQQVDALRASGQPVALVVDPVLGASSGGAAFCDEALLQAYRHELLPRATLITPNRREAERLLGGAAAMLSVPDLAAALREAHAPQAAICITGGDDLNATPGGTHLALDWLDSQIKLSDRPTLAVQGWLALPRLARQPLHHHGSGCSFATAVAAALARGFPLPDAVVLAKMLCWQGLRQGHAAGRGPGPLRPTADFIDDAQGMPVMGFGDERTPDAATLSRWRQVLTPSPPNAALYPSAKPPVQGLYGIVDRAERLAELAAAGLPHLQLRCKVAADLPPKEAQHALQAQIQAALQAVAPHPHVQLWINDHWSLALKLGATALHLGQEDWAALNAAERERIRARGARLGLSSHSLWELARARGLAPDYIACGPVWPTTTKDMPWLPQGLDHVAFWSRMAGCPVVAIGGILTPEQVRSAAAAGADAVCLVRGLAPERLPAFELAWSLGRLDIGTPTTAPTLGD